MRIDDQYFKPGDKVMRVGSNPPGGYTYPATGRKIPQFGEVLCVSDFWEGPKFNVVMFVGFGGWAYDPLNRPIGWRAAAFRKVEEIKLCLEAINKAPRKADIPTEITEEASQRNSFFT